MIEEHLAIVSTVGKMILEDQFASKGDVTTELLPLGQSEDEGRLESLQKGVRPSNNTDGGQMYLIQYIHVLQFLFNHVQVSLRFVNFHGHLFDSSAMPFRDDAIREGLMNDSI